MILKRRRRRAKLREKHLRRQNQDFKGDSNSFYHGKNLGILQKKDQENVIVSNYKNGLIGTN